MVARIGGHTVTIYERERGEHREYHETGTRVWNYCALEPLSAAVNAGSGRGGETADGRGRETFRWRIYAPAGNRAPSGAAQCTVSPGPEAADGTPLRLNLVATPQPVWNLRGVEDHVTVEVTATLP